MDICFSVTLRNSYHFKDFVFLLQSMIIFLNLDVKTKPKLKLLLTLSNSKQKLRLWQSLAITLSTIEYSLGLIMTYTREDTKIFTKNSIINYGRSEQLDRNRTADHQLIRQQIDMYGSKFYYTTILASQRSKITITCGILHIFH